MFCVMSSYELSATIISVLSLIATIFFGLSVFWLSRKANAISKEANEINRANFKQEVKETANKFEKIAHIENIDEIKKWTDLKIKNKKK